MNGIFEYAQRINWYTKKLVSNVTSKAKISNIVEIGKMLVNGERYEETVVILDTIVLLDGIGPSC